MEINRDTHFSIVPADAAMTVGRKNMGGLDFTSANIPEGINALQWANGQGELEYEDARANPNVMLDEVPEWAEKCLVLFDEAVQAELDENVRLEKLRLDASAPDPKITEIMDAYPTINYEDANELILMFSSKDLQLEIVSGTFMYDEQTQMDTPYRPVGIAITQLTGNGTLIVTKLTQLTEAAALVAIPILSTPFANNTQLRELNEKLGQSAYDYTNGEQEFTLYYPEWTLEKDKLKKAKDIDTERTAELLQGFEYEGKMYDAGLSSRANLADYMTLVNAGVDLPEGFTWRAKDNTDTAFDNTTLKDFANAMFTFMNDTYIKSWNRKGLISSAKTVKDVRAL
jgi:hypothetical protein